MAVLGIACVGSLGGRFRGAGTIEREQLKWFILATGAFLVTLVAAFATQSDALFMLSIVAATAIPVAAGIAILRYHLYEIDRIIGRTVAYGVITAVLAAAFVVTNVALQSLLLPGSTFEVAVSTLVVAMLFLPLRRAIQRPIDRRFNRAGVDAERLVAGFAARARDEVDLERLAGETRRVATGAVQPRTIGLWLRRYGKTA
jgi:hypothetical protein